VDAAIALIGKEGNVTPFPAAIELLSFIPGLSSHSATVIVSEVGVDMSRLPM
jgi:transposase